MSGDTQFGSLDAAEKVCTDSLNLLAVGTVPVKLKQFFGLSAAATHIDRIVHDDVITSKSIVCFVIADIGQLFILIGLTVQGLLYQFTGQNLCRVLVVTTVGQINIGFPFFGDGDTNTNISSGRAKRIRHRDTVATGIRDTHIITKLRQFLFAYQKVCKRKVEKLS